MICDFGCGELAIKVLKNGKGCCSETYLKCIAVRSKLSEKAKSRKPIKQTEEWIEKRISQLRGKKRPAELIERIQEKRRPKMIGKIPWNKGLKGVLVPWNKGNRKRTPVIGCKDDPFISLQRYRNRVSTRTGRNYEIYKDEINPNDYPRGRCGIEGAWQIDHIISVRRGFEERIPVEIIAAKENLQMLPWLENIRKYDK